MTGRRIPGWERYAVTDGGEVWGTLGPLSQRDDKDGYKTVRLSRDGKRSVLRVHRLVLLAFVGPAPADKPLGRHMDGNPANNRLDNLAWGSNSENQRDRVLHGTCPMSSRTHCKSGHEFSEENTGWEVRGSGFPSRRCKTCTRAASNKAYHKRMDASEPFVSLCTECGAEKRTKRAPVGGRCTQCVAANGRAAMVHYAAWAPDHRHDDDTRGDW